MLRLLCLWCKAYVFFFLSFSKARVESELLHTYSKVYKFDVVLLIVRLAVLTAVILTVPVVLFPVSVTQVERQTSGCH